VWTAPLMSAAAQVYQEGSNSARVPLEGTYQPGTRQPRQPEQRPPFKSPARRGSNSRVLLWQARGSAPWFPKNLPTRVRVLLGVPPDGDSFDSG
jgi:hypothetical protein